MTEELRSLLMEAGFAEVEEAELYDIAQGQCEQCCLAGNGGIYC